MLQVCKTATGNKRKREAHFDLSSLLFSLDVQIDKVDQSGTTGRLL